MMYLGLSWSQIFMAIDNLPDERVSIVHDMNPPISRGFHEYFGPGLYDLAEKLWHLLT